MPPVRAALQEAGCTDFMEDPAEQSLAFPPRFLDTARSIMANNGKSVRIMTCYLVCESNDSESYLIDVALREA